MGRSVLLLCQLIVIANQAKHGDYGIFPPNGLQCSVPWRRILFNSGRYSAVTEAILLSQVIILICVARVASGIIVTDYLSHGEYKEDDSKRLHEARQGVVTSAYSVLDPDGTRRTVHYIADPTHGFKALLVQEPGIDISPPTLLSSNLAADVHYKLEPYLEFHTTGPKKYFTPAGEILPDKIQIRRFYFEPNEKLFKST